MKNPNRKNSFRSSHQRCLKPATLLKKETLAQVFSCEFCEISKNTSFTEHLQTTASKGFVKITAKRDLRKFPL